VALCVLLALVSADDKDLTPRQKQIQEYDDMLKICGPIDMVAVADISGSISKDEMDIIKSWLGQLLVDIEKTEGGRMAVVPAHAVEKAMGLWRQVFLKFSGKEVPVNELPILEPAGGLPTLGGDVASAISGWWPRFFLILIFNFLCLGL